MSKKSITLIGVAIALATLYVVCFSDWLKPKNIHVYWTISPANPSTVQFHLKSACPLTSVEVVSAAEAKTSKYPHPLWHLVAKGAPALTANFAYGAQIPGMKPEIETALPEPLQPGVEYSLIVKSGPDLRGEKNFSLH